MYIFDVLFGDGQIMMGGGRFDVFKHHNLVIFKLDACLGGFLHDFAKNTLLGHPEKNCVRNQKGSTQQKNIPGTTNDLEARSCLRINIAREFKPKVALI